MRGRSARPRYNFAFPVRQLSQAASALPAFAGAAVQAPSLMQIVNISAYKFVSLDDIETLRPAMRERCEAAGLKGTILLAPEGINMFLAGPREAIDGFMAWLHADARFADIAPKESLSENQPFKRMLVRAKKEIITMKMPLIRPEEGRAPSVRRWT